MFKSHYLLHSTEPGEPGGGGGATDYDKLWDEIPSEEKIKRISKFASNNGGKFFISDTDYKRSMKEYGDAEAQKAVGRNYEKTKRLLNTHLGVEIPEGVNLEDILPGLKDTFSKQGEVKIEETPEYKALQKKLKEINEQNEGYSKELTQIKSDQEKSAIDGYFSKGIPKLDYPEDELEFVKVGVEAQLRQLVTIKKEGDTFKAFRSNGEPYLDNQGNPLSPDKAVQEAAKNIQGIKIKVHNGSVPNGRLSDADMAGLKQQAEKEANSKGLFATSKDYWIFMKSKGIDVPELIAKKFGIN